MKLAVVLAMAAVLVSSVDAEAQGGAALAK
jgi:hypothetical protein